MREAIRMATNGGLYNESFFGKGERIKQFFKKLWKKFWAFIDRIFNTKREQWRW